MKRALIIVAAITLAVFRPSMFADIKFLRPRAQRTVSGNVVLNTNIMASCWVGERTSNSITLNLEATSMDGLPIQYFDIYRDGVWIDRVTLPLPAPSTLRVTP